MWEDSKGAPVVAVGFFSPPFLRSSTGMAAPAFWAILDILSTPVLAGEGIELVLWVTVSFIMLFLVSWLSLGNILHFCLLRFSG